MAPVAVRLDKYIDASMKKTFHEYLRFSTNIINNNKYSGKDNTVKILSPLIKNKNDKIVIVAADKEACTVKVNNIIKEGTEQGNYIKTIDITQSDLQHFQDFHYRHFKKSEHYDQMRPVSNQSSRFFATAKTRKSASLNDITIENLKLCPIRDLTVTCTYNTSKNQYTISDNLKFPA